MKVEKEIRINNLILPVLKVLKTLCYILYCQLSNRSQVELIPNIININVL